MAKRAQPVQGPAPQPTASFCKQANGVIRINLQGDSINLEGFGFPATGFAVHYATKPSPVPIHPDDSFGLSTAEEININPATGDWTCTLLDACDDVNLTERTIVVWYKYESDFDVHWLIETFSMTPKMPVCDDIPAC